MSAVVIEELPGEAAAEAAVVAARRAAASALEGQAALEAIARACQRWSREPAWRARVAQLSPAAAAELDPVMSAELWSAEWRAGAALLGVPQSPGVRLGHAPLGVVLHVCPGNGAGTAVWSLLHGVLAGNQNLVRLSRKAPPAALVIAELLIDCGLPPGQVRFITWEHERDEVRRRLQRQCDAIAAWGREESIALFRDGLAPGVAWIEHGPKLSLAVVTASQQRDDSALAGVVADVCDHEQRSCSSVQALLVERGDDDARDQLLARLAERFAAYAAVRPPPPKTPDEQVEMLKRLDVARIDAVRGAARVVSGWPDWLVVWRAEGPILPTCLYRTLYVYGYRDRAQLAEKVSAIRHHLQTASLACAGDEEAAYTALLWRAGVTRVAAPGSASRHRAGTPQDGALLLPQFWRLTSFESAL